MSSLEESMFEMEYEFLESSEPAPSPQAISMHQQTTCHVLEGVLGRSTKLEMEVCERAMKHVKEIGEERKSSSLKRRLMMRLRMDGYDASLCRSSWVATTEHPGGDYEYIDIQSAGKDGATSRLIVDIDFRSQFQLARSTPSYARLSGALPPVFVGPQEKLKKAVALLCMAAQRSLRESGLHVPPWRRSSYVQAKWLPTPFGALRASCMAPPMERSQLVQGCWPSWQWPAPVGPGGQAAPVSSWELQRCIVSIVML